VNKNLDLQFYGKKSIKKGSGIEKNENKRNCPYPDCNKVYTSKAALTVHIRQKHTVSDIIKIESDNSNNIILSNLKADNCQNSECIPDILPVVVISEQNKVTVNENLQTQPSRTTRSNRQNKGNKNT